MSSTDEDDVCVVVLDNGSYKIQAGFAGDDAPRSRFRTVVGIPLYEGQTVGGRPPKNCYVGDGAIAYMDILDVRRPIERGVVTDWDAMESVWKYAFDDLFVKSSETNVLLTEPPLNPKTNREKMTQVMFEKFSPLGLYVMGPTLLSLFSSGRGTGLVIDSGYEVTTVGCIYEGYKLPQTMFRCDIGGNDITNYLIELLAIKGYTFSTASEIEEVQNMKNLHAFVSATPEEEKVNNIEMDYTCSDGTTIRLGYERFQCMEAMFNPTLVGSNAFGIHELIAKSITACPQDFIRDLCRNIIISGSNTMAQGLVARLQKELETLMPSLLRVKVVAPPERKSSTWIGGSIRGSLSTTESLWITQTDYDEFGPNVIYRSDFNQYW
ncbi:uncharacterized protein [Argopecten irradians]|uniref:uncharacterized protein isoform X1 n=1 Tax=Argopecten irradians TaxID=31199 RepID=UPI003721BCBE